MFFNHKNRKKKKGVEAENAERDIFVYDDHRLTSRRDFLASGLIPFAAWMAAPSLVTLLSRQAWAACGESSGLSSFRPFIQLNLSGGANLGANLVPRNSGGDLLSNYDLMGMGTRPNLRTGAGNDFFFSKSSLLAGMEAAATGITGTSSGLTLARDYLSKTTAIAVCCQSRDDSGINKFDPLGLISKAGLVGSHFPIMNAAGATYGQMPAYLTPPPPLNVSSYQDVRTALVPQGALGEKLNSLQRQELFKLVGDLNAAQVQELARSGSSDTTQLGELLGCAATKNNTLISSAAPATDPRKNTDLAAIWGINTGSSDTLEAVVFATAVYNSLTQQATATRLEKGGYDYHDKTRTSGNNRDREAGLAVGRVLASAAALGRPCFVYLTTDGSTESPRSTDDQAVWQSDRGEAGLTIIFAYDPAGRPSLQDQSGGRLANQIGYFIEGQAAGQDYVPGWSTDKAAAAVFANYMRWCGSDAWTIADQILRDNGAFTTADYNKILKFG